MKKLFTLLFIALSAQAFSQKPDQLTVEKIMRDPKWIGTSPSRVQWSDDSKKLYFNWNPEKAERPALYRIATASLNPEKLSLDERKALIPSYGEWNKKHTKKLYEKGGDIYLYNLLKGISYQLTRTSDRESSPRFGAGDNAIIFQRSDNLFELNLGTGELDQLTNFKHSGAANIASGGNKQEKWLKSQQLELFEVIKKGDNDRKLDSMERKEMEPKKVREINVGDKGISDQALSPDGRFITYRLITSPKDEKRTIVPNYVTASGWTEEIPNREKVGGPQSTSESFIFDTQKDTVYKVLTADLPGIKDIPAYIHDYPKELEAMTKANADRDVVVFGPFWSEDGKNAVVVAAAEDYKDRWIMKLDPATGHLSILDRQHDDAWISGPGIGGDYYEGNVGWLDQTHFYYQSEASGFSHIYVVDVVTGNKKQLTNGKWEVQTLQLSNDKKTFYFTANIDHPGVKDFYRLPVSGGNPVKLTSMKGENAVELSPDEQWLAITYSYINKPQELYLQANRPGSKAIKVTNSVSDEFNSYAWRDPEVITFKNRYGADVYGRVYIPQHPDPAKPAVLFVHGAGYLQNITYAWGHYFREYMFNNLLADQGYYVMDIDYTASAGYGRDWRTGVYRHMGGKDLSDHVDAVKYLIEKYGINPKHVGIYGGSYGGFMTLMALLTEPDVFTSGAAIRSVTDWAHYNHGYTASILNEPTTDEKSYRQSSPIYFADGLKGNLLMLHGMVDQNVNFQDIVRLTQKLIELHKDNWWLAPYPVEDHGFEQPSSWTDEYKRIFKLFEETLK